jgi:hypothetical protein
MDTGISIWASASISQLAASTDQPLHRHVFDDFTFDVKLLGDSLWGIALSEKTAVSGSGRIFAGRLC